MTRLACPLLWSISMALLPTGCGSERAREEPTPKSVPGELLTGFDENPVDPLCFSAAFNDCPGDCGSGHPFWYPLGEALLQSDRDLAHLGLHALRTTTTATGQGARAWFGCGWASVMRFAGVRFWGRSAGPLRVSLGIKSDEDAVISDNPLIPEAGVMPRGFDAPAAYRTAVSLQDQWAQHTVLFADMRLAEGEQNTAYLPKGAIRPAMLQATGALDFLAEDGGTFWLDDIELVWLEEPDGTGEAALENGPSKGAWLPTPEQVQRCAEAAAEARRGSVEPDPSVLPELTWPNDQSQVNSDPWLAANHDRITRMRPRVLVLNFNNGHSPDEVLSFARKVAAQIEQSTRYHGYHNPAAPAFVQPVIDRVIDLTDPGGEPDTPGARRPLRPDGRFDYAALFGPALAALYGYLDPRDGQRSLGLCELFERGLVHEVWVSSAGPGGPEELLARVPVYDTRGRKTGAFERCAGNGCFYDEAASGQCAVTVRIADLNLQRGPGCALHGQAHGMEGLRNAIAYYRRESARFYNFDLLYRKEGIPFQSLYQCPNTQRDPTYCVHHESIDRAVNASKYARVLGKTWDIPPFSADLSDGCGNVHFTPNSRYHYDYDGTFTPLNYSLVQNSCESYGLRNGPGGRDRKTCYSFALVEENDLDPDYTDCGGGWLIYMRQSFPGLQNRATDTAGRPMKNWWPFLFY